MTNELMPDKNQPEPEQGTVSNIMDRSAMRSHVVVVKFIKKDPKSPDQVPRRIRFPTAVLAREFVDKLQPRVELGSRKQADAARARMLNLQAHLYALYNIEVSIEANAAVAATPTDDPLANFGGEELNEDEPDTFVEGAETSEAAPEPTDDLSVDDILSEVNNG